eukprot:10134030-Heterocapsa_arctica.AAC.1
MAVNVHSGWMVSQVSGPGGAHPLARTCYGPGLRPGTETPCSMLDRRRSAYNNQKQHILIL